jgi:hypothetical protein
MVEKYSIYRRGGLGFHASSWHDGMHRATMPHKDPSWYDCDHRGMMRDDPFPKFRKFTSNLCHCIVVRCTSIVVQWYLLKTFVFRLFCIFSSTLKVQETQERGGLNWVSIMFKNFFLFFPNSKTLANCCFMIRLIIKINNRMRLTTNKRVRE